MTKVPSFKLALAAASALGLTSVGVIAASSALADDSAETTAVGARPDFSGNWTHRRGGGIRAVNTEEGICVINCGPPPGAEGGSTPRRARPKPSFPKYKDELLAEVERLNKEQVLHDPALRCVNPGLPRIGPPDKIMQTADEIVFLYDDLNGSFWRVIPTDGRAHRDDAEESFLGDSVGQWEGDKLVIETISFNDMSWLTDNGAFHTYDMKVIEVMSMDDEGAISYELTVHDPEVLAEPWVKSAKLTTVDLPPIEPVPCVEMSIDQMTGIESYHPNARW